MHETGDRDVQEGIDDPELSHSAAGGGIWQKLGDRRRGPSGAGVRHRASRSGRVHGARAALRRSARASEGHSALPERDEGVVADHEVIEQLDIQQAPGGQCFGSQVQVVW